MLGHAPSESFRRGDTRTIRTTGSVITRKSGMWSLKARKGHGDLDVQVTAIFDLLTPDLAIWKDLCSRYEVDIFCGFFMGESSAGLGLETSTMAALSSRGVRFGVCLYEPC